MRDFRGRADDDVVPVPQARSGGLPARVALAAGQTAGTAAGPVQRATSLPCSDSRDSTADIDGKAVGTANDLTYGAGRAGYAPFRGETAQVGNFRPPGPGSRVAESLDPPLHPSISLIHATWSAVSREGRRTRPTSAVMAVMT